MMHLHACISLTSSFLQLHASESRVVLDRVVLTSCALQILSSAYPALLVYCEWLDLRRPRFGHCFLECLEFLGFLDFLGCLEVLGVLGFLECPVIHDQNAATGWSRLMDTYLRSYIEQLCINACHFWERWIWISRSLLIPNPRWMGSTHHLALQNPEKNDRVSMSR